MSHVIDPLSLIRPRRKIIGMSAVLLPFLENGDIDWSSFRQQLLRTSGCGLTPAVNMDTGYANLIDDSTRRQVLAVTRETLGQARFVAGAYVGDTPGSRFALDLYSQQLAWIIEAGGTPVIFQSYGLTQQSDEGVVESYRQLGQRCD